MEPAYNDPIFTDENAAREALEAVRWPHGPVCPHCAATSEQIARVEGTKKSHRPGLMYCNGCKGQFTVTVGTVFERSKIPLTKWWLATHLMCSSKKGVSSHQIHRTLGVTYKTAWFMTHRIRESMKDTSTRKLGGRGSSGIVEADETYFGRTEGRGKGAHITDKEKVVALVERGGRMRAFHVPSVNAETLKPMLKDHISKSARLMTDTASYYQNITDEFKSHETVNHGVGEYVRGDVTTNSVEGFFGVLKLGIGGVYQHVSPAHLHRYVNEFSFRYNNRVKLGIDDADRTINAMKGISGKRLTYKQPD